MKSILLLSLCCVFLLQSNAKESSKIKKIDGFVFVPSGKFVYNEAALAVLSFWMSQGEVTNLQYREFLSDLKAQNRTEDFKKALPDTAAWNLTGTYLVPMMNLYFSHPAYNNYPVVNVNTEGANLYCGWLLENLKKEYGNDLIKSVRLPTNIEWTYAASAGIDGAIYSWAGKYLRDSEGNFMANFKNIGDENSTTIDSVAQIIPKSFGENFQDGAYLIAQSISYSSNLFNLYNMSGNVSELVVAQSTFGESTRQASQQIVAIGGNWNSTGYDIRVTSEIPFEKANPFVGFRPIISVQ